MKSSLDSRNRRGLKLLAPLKARDGVRRNAGVRGEIARSPAQCYTRHFTLDRRHFVTPIRFCIATYDISSYRIPVTNYTAVYVRPA